MKLLVLILFMCAAVFTDARSPREKRSSLFDSGECKELGDDCDGMPRCCGDLVCYWEGGISPFRDGVCVECIREGNQCQKDAQCCEPLACIKEKIYYVNGECRQKLDTGGHCHNDYDCKSGKCEREYMLSLHGYCA